MVAISSIPMVLVGGRCSRGGIICDSLGSVIRAFSSFYENGTIMFAEIMALKEGLRLCRSMGFANFTVETDSKVVVLVIMHNESAPWRYEYEPRDYRSNLGDYSLVHVFRERNQVAERLATIAHTHQDLYKRITYFCKICNIMMNQLGLSRLEYFISDKFAQILRDFPNCLRNCLFY